MCHRIYHCISKEEISQRHYTMQHQPPGDKGHVELSINQLSLNAPTKPGAHIRSAFAYGAHRTNGKQVLSCHKHQWASYQIRKIVGCACTGNAGKVFFRHRLQRNWLDSDPSMHHGTCVTHVPWCMSGSLAGGGGENVSGIPGACATHTFMYLVRGPWL